MSHNHNHQDFHGNSDFHKYFHYHSGEENGVHSNSIGINHDDKNIVLCILFNRDDHKGTDANNFFSQFVNTQTFKNEDSVKGRGEINTHKNWSLENLLPLKIIFQYTPKISDVNVNADVGKVIVFDSIQSIDLGILNILKHKSKNISRNNFEGNKKPDTILYKRNVEVITDDKYKELMRSQIKDLLSTFRMSTMRSKKLIYLENI